MEERLLGRGKTSGRADDNPETILKRLAVFQNDTVPVVKNMTKKENYVLNIDAEQPPDKVYENLKTQLL